MQKLVDPQGEMDISIGEGEGNQVKFNITMLLEQEPVADFFLNKFFAAELIFGENK